MIKDFKPKQYSGIDMLPRYVKDIKVLRLLGLIKGGYTITLARLTIGNSMSDGTPLTHVLYESFTDHGEPAKTARTRARGVEHELVAVKNAMAQAGVSFGVTFAESSEAILYALGQYFQGINDDITTFSIVSQTCH